MNNFFIRKISLIFFVAVVIIYLLSMLYLCKDYGLTNAECDYQLTQATQLHRYYSSFGDDKSILENTNPQYSSWFNALTAGCGELFIDADFLIIRRFLNVIMAVVGLVFVGLFAKSFAGYRTGIVAMLMLALSPIFFAFSAFNVDDIPVATCFVTALYFLKRLCDAFPNPKILDAIFCSLFTGLAVASLPTTLILIPLYLFALIFILVFKRHDTQIKSATIRYSCYIVLVILLQAVLVFLLVPILCQTPFDITKWFNSIQPLSMKQILFEGNLYWTDLLPWYYNVKMLIITTPVFVFIGVLLCIVLCFWKKKNRIELVFLLLTSIVAIFIFSLSSNDGGWYHLLFAILPLYILAAVGFEQLVQIANKKSHRIACVLLPFILMSVSFVHIVRNHPYECVYFNEFAGGVKGAFGRYEFDNYGLANKEAVDWIVESGKYNLSGNQLFVGVQNENIGKRYFEEHKHEVSIVGSNYAERSNHIWDYSIFHTTGIEPDLLQSGYFPPQNTVKIIKVDDLPICVVLERQDTCDLYGRGFMAANDLLKSRELLLSAASKDTTNESLLVNLILVNMRLNDKEAMKLWIDKYLSISPRSDVGNYFNALYFNIIGNKEEAINICKQLITNNQRCKDAYLLLSMMYLQEGNYNEAESTILLMVDYDIYDENAARQLVRVYNSQKKDIRDAEISYYQYAYQSYKQRHKVELARKYKKLLDEAVKNR